MRLQIQSGCSTLVTMTTTPDIYIYKTPHSFYTRDHSCTSRKVERNDNKTVEPPTQCSTPDLCLYSSSWSNLDKQQNFGQGSKPKSWPARRRVTGKPGRLPDNDKMVSLEAYIKHIKKHHDFDLTNPMHSMEILCKLPA